MPGLKWRGLETERQTGVTVTGVAQPTGKPAEHEGPRTYHTGEATAPVSDPTQRAILMHSGLLHFAPRLIPGMILNRTGQDRAAVERGADD
jgi:hypothetical protein